MSRFRKAILVSALFLTVAGPAVAHARDPGDSDSGIWKQSDPSIWGHSDSSDDGDDSSSKSTPLPMTPGSKEPYIDQFGLPRPGIAVINGVAVTTGTPPQPQRDFAYVPPPPRAADDGAATGSPLPPSSVAPSNEAATNMIRKSLGQPPIKKDTGSDSDSSSDSDDSDDSSDGGDQQ